MGGATEVRLFVASTLIFTMITMSSAMNANRVGDGGHPGVPQTFWGRFEGNCNGNGFYYADVNNFVFCFHGNSYIMPCAPGTENSEFNAYADDVGRKKSDLEFCNVNLVASGYQDLELPRYGRRIENAYHPSINNYHGYQPDSQSSHSLRTHQSNSFMSQNRRQVRYQRERQGQEAKPAGYSRRLEGKRANVGPYEPNVENNVGQRYQSRNIQSPRGEDKVVIKIRQQRTRQNKANKPEENPNWKQNSKKEEDRETDDQVSFMKEQKETVHVDAPYNDPQREFNDIEIRFPSTIYDEVDYQLNEESLVYTPGKIFDNNLLKSPYLPRADIRNDRSSGYRRLNQRDSMLSQPNSG